MRLEANETPPTDLNEPTQETPFNPFIFLPPALCDMTATSIQYIGLTLTYASSFQMLRGKFIFFPVMVVYTGKIELYKS